MEQLDKHNTNNNDSSLETESNSQDDLANVIQLGESSHIEEIPLAETQKESQKNVNNENECLNNTVPINNGAKKSEETHLLDKRQNTIPSIDSSEDSTQVNSLVKETFVEKAEDIENNRSSENGAPILELSNEIKAGEAQNTNATEKLQEKSSSEQNVTLGNDGSASFAKVINFQIQHHSLSEGTSPVHCELPQPISYNLVSNSNASSPKFSQKSPTLTSVPASTELSEKYISLQGQLKNYESEIEQLKKALSQKDNTITLYQRENALLEKEKSAFRREKEAATKEKESIVITFATKEKSLIDAKKQKEAVEKQLADSRKEVKNISTKFHALNEEKSRIMYMLDEKCNEVKKFQKELEKQKTEVNSLEMKLKWNSVKLAQETEAKLIAEKKLEEERNHPKPHEEKANEKIKMEYEATAILLKHEIENKDKSIETLTKDQKQATEKINQLQESLSKEKLENTNLSRQLECLRQEHVAVQGSYSEEMLNSAKLRGQLEELQVLKTQHTINEDKIKTLTLTITDLESKLLDSTQDLEQVQAKEQELLSINKEMSEMIVGLQNEICLQTSRGKGIEAENEILKKEKLDFDTKYSEIELQLKNEIQQKNDERLLLTKHLSEKTKMYESVKIKLENAQGDLEATKKKHSQVVKELQREIQKYKKVFDENTAHGSPTGLGLCRNCKLKSTSQEQITSNHSRGSNNSRSDSESEVQSNTSTMNRDVQGPSKQHLVERILRLQQASARQTEKIDFLENHTMSLVSELQKKSKVVQYYMMRDQAGALTSSKSDQNKTELAKYGGVMSAIYSGIKGPNQSMTLELSLEINKKLQAVLEDTLLKNITLKENLDVLGLEVDKLTRKLAQLKS